MGTRKSSRGTKAPVKLKVDFVTDDFLTAAATPQQMSNAIQRELSHVESRIKELTPKSSKADQTTVDADKAIENLRNQNLQLELQLTKTKLELIKLQRETKQPSATKMATAATTQLTSASPDGNPIEKTTLKSLQQDPGIQSELKSLMDSLGDPVLLG